MKKIATVFLIAVVLYSACDVVNSHRVKGDGNMTSENVQIGDFTGVENHTSFEVYLTQGNSTAVKIEAEKNILSYIDVHTENGMLNIDTKEGNVWLDATQPVKIFVTAPAFSRIHNTGSGSITGQTKITHDSKLDISSTGSGASKLDVDAPEITASVTGS